LDDLEIEKNGAANKEYISTTDPDASVIRRGKGKSKLRYKTHRAVDSKSEVITATEVTGGATDEGEKLGEVIEQHQQNTGCKVQTAVADSRYGTKKNYLMCFDQDIKAHMPNLEEVTRGKGSQKGIFAKEAFDYDQGRDLFVCPAGQVLRKRRLNKQRQTYEYVAGRGACAKCEIKAKCTRSKTGRTLQRHIRQDDLDRMLEEAARPSSKQDLKTRQHLSERSFARSTRYGYKRARWRGLWRMQIQDYLIAAIQNIKTLIRETERRAANAVRPANSRVFSGGEGSILFVQRIADRILSRNVGINHPGFMFA
jgi:hypothetical protein